MSGYNRLTGVAALAAVLAAGLDAASAADVRVTTSVGSRLEVTDNVDLDPDGEKQAAIVSSVGPAAQVSVDGNRLDLLFAGSVNFLHYSHDNSVKIDQNLRGDANAELWEDWLYLDLSGSSTRQLTDPESRVSASDSSRGERESVTVLEASPYLAHAFGNWANGELRYRRIQTFGQESGDTAQDEQRFELASGTRFTRTSGALLFEHVKDETDDEEGDEEDGGTGFGSNDDVERTTGQLSGQYAVWRRFSLTGIAGYDKIDTEGSSDDLGGPFYQFGFDTRPGPRSRFALGVGQRYGGLWVQGEFEYDITDRLILAGSIDRVLETNTDRRADQRLGAVVDPVTGELVTEDLNEDAQSGVAVTWRGNLGLTGLYGRNGYNIDVIYVGREFEDRDETTYGLRGAWTRQLSRTWSSRVTGFATRLDGEPSNDTVGAQASLDYLIYTNTVISFGVSHTQRFADDADDEYSENTAFVAGRLRF